MVSRIRKRMQAGGNESGFTLIELLVVVIIIAILAAIAIPMYLAQRQKGYRANSQSDLRNAAVAAEAYFTDGSTYVGLDLAELQTNGFSPSADVTTAVDVATATTYCIDSVHSSGGGTWHIGNRAADSGAPESGGC